MDKTTKDNVIAALKKALRERLITCREYVSGNGSVEDLDTATANHVRVLESVRRKYGYKESGELHIIARNSLHDSNGYLVLN